MVSLHTRYALWIYDLFHLARRYFFTVESVRCEITWLRIKRRRNSIWIHYSFHFYFSFLLSLSLSPRTNRVSEFIKEIFIKEPQTYVKPFPGIFRWICISSIIYGTVYAFVHTNVEPFLAKAANFTGFFLSLIYLISLLLVYDKKIVRTTPLFRNPFDWNLKKFLHSRYREIACRTIEITDDR